jgi:hypothetical protein
VKIVEILVTAVPFAEHDHRVQFLGDHGFRWICADARWRIVEQRRILGFQRRWFNGVAEPDVDLDRNA